MGFETELNRELLQSWVSAEVFEQGVHLFNIGAVQGVRLNGNKFGGTIKEHSATISVFATLTETFPIIKCNCKQATNGNVCRHFTAAALKLLETKQPTVNPRDAFQIENIKRWTTQTRFQEAEKLFKKGSIISASYGNGIVKSQVLQPDSGKILTANFRLISNSKIKNQCSCGLNLEHGEICPHVIATSIFLSKKYNDPQILNQRNAEKLRGEAIQKINAENYIQRGKNGIPATLQLKFPKNFQEEIQLGSVHVSIAVKTRTQILRPQDVPSDKVFTFSATDETILDILEDAEDGPFSDSVALTANDVVFLLKNTTSSLTWHDGRSLKIIDEPIETKLNCQINEKTGDLILKLQIPGMHPGTFFVVAGTAGVVIDDVFVVPLKSVLAGPYQILYKNEIEIPHDNLFNFMIRELAGLTEQIKLSNDSVTPDLFTASPCKPKFKLSLYGTRESVRARLFAQYGSHEIPAGSLSQRNLVFQDSDDFYHFFSRDFKAETDAISLLSKFGILVPDGQSSPPVTDERQINNLIGTGITQAKREAWHVELHDEIKDIVEQSELIIPVVKLAERSTGFDIQYTYETPHKALKIPEVEIQRAIQCQNAFVKHNGKLVFLDIGAIAAMRDIFADLPVESTQTPGAFRVSSIYASFVQSALTAIEGIDFDCPKNWLNKTRLLNRESAIKSVDLGELNAVLRSYQKAGVNWLRYLEEEGFCGILADEMGLGKTLQTLAWLNLPRVNKSTNPALIICPTSLVENWKREAEKFIPSKKVLVISGHDRQEKLNRISDFDLVITSYALIRRDVDFYQSHDAFSALVLDEAQAIKNRDTQNALAVKSIPSETRLVLSGTPLENSVSDLWSIMDFLMPNYLGAYPKFKMRYQDMIEVGGLYARDALKKLHNKLHPFLLRRLKRDVAKDLPEKIQQVVYCTLSSDQERLYLKIKNDVKTQIKNLVETKGFNKSRMEILAQVMRLRQICCDTRLLKGHKPAANEATSDKLSLFIDLLSEAISDKHRILVFSQYTSMLQLIAMQLGKEKIKYCYLDGSTKNRLDICSQFNQDSSIPVFLISLKAGGTGLNLTGADMVIHYDPWWNPAAEDQATDRAHRIGQKKTVYALKLITQGTIEENVLKMQTKKQELINAAIGNADAAIAQALTLDDIKKIIE